MVLHIFTHTALTFNTSIFVFVAVFSSLSLCIAITTLHLSLLTRECNIYIKDLMLESFKDGKIKIQKAIVNDPVTMIWSILQTATTKK